MPAPVPMPAFEQYRSTGPNACSVETSTVVGLVGDVAGMATPRPSAATPPRSLGAGRAEVGDHDTGGALGGEPPHQAAPMPLPPPVTTHTAPSRSMGRSYGRGLLSRRRPRWSHRPRPCGRGPTATA